MTDKQKYISIIFLISLISISIFLYLNNQEKSKPVTIDSMSTEEKIGQLVMLGIDGYSLNFEAIKLIKDEHVGGIILTGKNIKSIDQLHSLNNQIKELNRKENKIPIFISTDEEGGIISRMPHGIKNLPSSGEIGEHNDPQLALEIGEAIGERVNEFGFNMTMAPVMDVNSNANNPVIGKRSFGSDEKLVAKLGNAEIKGIQSKHIIPVIKHFPGHGDTDTDSHKGLPVVNHDLKRLREIELYPFKEAIKENADVVMAAHILIPNIDSKYPSSLSKEVITELLRKELHFNGVVITDDMTMGAVSKNFDIGEAAVTSILAGTDIILVNHGTKNKKTVLRALTQAVKEGIISEERLNTSLERVLKLKNKYQLSDESTDQVNINKINKSSENILKKGVQTNGADQH